MIELACNCTSEPNKRFDIGHVVNVLVPLMVPLVKQWNPTSTHQQEDNCDIIYEENYDMPIMKILTSR